MAAKRPTRKQQHAAFLRRCRQDGTYQQLLEQQGGVCGICATSEADYRERTGRRLDIDHDHARAVLVARGLLCRGCNLRLRRGLDAAWLAAAADYMRRAA